LQGGDFVAQGGFPDKGQAAGLVISAECLELLLRLLYRGIADLGHRRVLLPVFEVDDPGRRIANALVFPVRLGQFQDMQLQLSVSLDLRLEPVAQLKALQRLIGVGEQIKVQQMNADHRFEHAVGVAVPQLIGQGFGQGVDAARLPVGLPAHLNRAGNSGDSLV